ncbi:MAG TPA: EAL domain-containing protein [Gemmatimonadaceae bacterium]
MITNTDIRNARILIVDDSSVNVNLLERLLQGAGYKAVTSTVDPRAVCAMHRADPYDLILLDLLMPVMDGFEVMEALKEIETEGYLPVLVLTAEPGHKLRALKAGAKDFLSKPFDQVEVLTRISNMLEVRLLLQESRSYGRLLELYDQLTGLPNRKRFNQLLARLLHRPDADLWTVSVLFVAVDNFKSVNGAVGRAGGGALLRGVSERLAACLGPTDTVARLEGADFGLIVVSPCTDSLGAAVVAKRVRESFFSPLVAEGVEATVTVSIGIAVSSVEAPDADTLMRFAEQALQEAKQTGGDTSRFHLAEMDARAGEALLLENALRDALARNEFVLHYQPKLHLDTSEWSGAEALLRWNRPGHGLIQPAAFIPMLEATGLIVPVGNWVIATACQQVSEWASEGLGDIPVAVNVSGKQFLLGGVAPVVERALQDSGIAPDLLHIEITESSLMTRSEEAETLLRALRALGVQIAIDDFGTGYSSLAYLKRFPIDTLKIDISFIRDVTTSEDGAAIAVAIINMARSLKMRVIAEGVETQSQLDWLRQNACDEIQGFLYSRPLPATELARLREAHCAATPGRVLS